jgi:23S rRNA pseudouridine2605 synthase
LKKIVRGIDAGGEHLRANRATVLRAGGKNSWIEVALDEGKNRHLRRLLKALGVEVLRLIRVSIGPLELGKLSKGTVRPLTDVEKASMDQALTASTRAV